MTITKEDLEKAYGVFGTITSCVIKKPNEANFGGTQTGKFTHSKPTQFAFINFRLKDEAREALQKARENEAIKALYEDSPKGTFDLYFHMKREQFNMFKESKNRSKRFYQQQIQMNQNMGMMEQYPPYMMMPPPMDPRYNRRMPNYQRNPMDFYGNQYGMQGGRPMFRPDMMANQMPGHFKKPAGPPTQRVNRPKKSGGNYPPQQNNNNNKNKMPMQSQPNQINPAFLKENLSEFLKFDREKQRTLLGEIIFPMIKKQSNDELAPKITGMLIDFEVFEVQEILEFLDNEELLGERVQEAIDLINQSSN